MDTERIKQLIDKFYEGQTSLEEEEKLRRFFQREDIPDKFKSHAEYFRFTAEITEEVTGDDFDPFAKIDAKPEAHITHLNHQPGADENDNMNFSSKTLIWSLRVAAGFILLLTGFVAGQFIHDESVASTEQVAALQQEVQQMKEALMYGNNYRQASAGERLSAVKMSAQFASRESKLDQQITDILIYTMNNDKSVNVRMAAAEALFQFREEVRIQKALVNALTQQDEPQMQLTLIDMLVQLKATGALNEMNKLLMDSDTREIVRQRLQAGIAELKT